MATLETGAGLDTLVFAAGGAEHVAVTPEPAEEERFRAACRELEHRRRPRSLPARFSHEVLPTSGRPRPLDLVLVDGAHGFPYPILDWWFLAPHVRIGGRRAARRRVHAAGARRSSTRCARAARGRSRRRSGYRTVVVRKVADELPAFDWDGERIGGGMSFAYLGAPPVRSRRRGSASSRRASGCARSSSRADGRACASAAAAERVPTRSAWHCAWHCVWHSA